MNRKSIIVLSLLLSPLTLAQNYPDMSFQEMQSLFMQIQKVQQCLDKIPPEKLKALQQRGFKLQTETQNLCKAGKRDVAQKSAMDFAKSIENDKTMTDVKVCSKILQTTQAGQFPLFDVDKDYSRYHVCDF